MSIAGQYAQNLNTISNKRSDYSINERLDNVRAYTATTEPSVINDVLK